MPIDFPNSPSNGTQHTVGGVTWEYDGTVWDVVSGGSAFRVSATAPSSPVTGDLWYDTDSGEMFIYYDSAWVSPSVVATVAASVKVSATAPTAPAIGDLWFDSNTGDLTIYYDSQWVSPSVAASLATASASTITGTNAEGTSTSFARADHNHAFGSKSVPATALNLPGCRVYNSGNLTVANATAYAIPFNSEHFDTDGLHSTSTNTSRITISTAGVYSIGGNIRCAANGTGGRDLYILLNGTTALAQVGFNGSATTANVSQIQVHSIWKLEANDYIQLFFYQTSGGNLNIERFANLSPEFWAQCISAG